MATRRERDLDAALAALAGEVADATPQPGVRLSGRVLSDAAVALLAREALAASPVPDAALTSAVVADAALEMLARDVAALSPRPDDALVARVLADAAGVAAGAAAAGASAAAGRPARRARAAAPARRRLAGLLFGWQGGAVAAMLLALVAGLGVGLEMQPGALPLIEAREAPNTAPISLAALATGPFGTSGL